MYIIIISILIVAILLFWSVIESMIKTITNSSLDNGYLWYIILLIINILVVIVLVWVYNSKIKQPGNLGLPGAKGFPGYQGDECYFASSCSKN